MDSLNDIVGRAIQGNSGMFEHKGISIELDFDPNMPKLYEEFKVGTPLQRALSQLNVEVEDAKPSRALYRTQFESGVQRLVVCHNGSQIPVVDLRYLNSFLRDIAEGRKEWREWRHGNLIAGQAIKEYSGRIWLENINEKGYRVKTTMEIPVKTSSE